MSDTRSSSEPRSTSEPRSRRVPPLAALTVVAALSAGISIAGYTAHRQGSARQHTAPPAAPTPSATPSAAPAAHRPVPVAAEVGVATRPVAVRYGFDAGPRRPILDTAGRHLLRSAVASGGLVRFVTRAAGWAVAFPARCTTDPRRCPRAILQGVRDDGLNPGTRPVHFGASIFMRPSDTSAGANVLQKGYSVGGATQFKLQVDGARGRPSCVIASASRIYKIEARRTIADSRWHNVACYRVGGALTIVVDGVVAGSRAVPARLSIANAEPLRIGGKGTAPYNDQFSGQLDNVFVSIS